VVSGAEAPFLFVTKRKVPRLEARLYRASRSE
jgi:hypothetical protein